jgi:hypothetical protein
MKLVPIVKDQQDLTAPNAVLQMEDICLKVNASVIRALRSKARNSVKVI